MGFHSHSRMTMDRHTKLTVLITSQPPIVMQVTIKPARIGFPLTLTHDNGPSYKTVLIISQPPIIIQVTMKPARIGFPLTLTPMDRHTKLTVLITSICCCESTSVETETIETVWIMVPVPHSSFTD